MAQKEKIYRHRLPVRLWHWLNVVAFFVLLMSGLQIFNYHPALYWGENGHYGMESWLSINAPTKNAESDYSTLKIGSLTIPVTGILGVQREEKGRLRNFAFPPLVTLPAERSLALGRDWHFLAAWVFSFNILFYLFYGLFSRHFWRDLLPTIAQLKPQHILADLWSHMRFRRITGEGARHYNLLQKLAYAFVIFILLPVMVLSGLTMSNAVTTVFPELFSLFGGRQSARTIHFIAAFGLVGFVIIHIIQIFVAGFWNEIRSMITGWFTLETDTKDQGTRK